MDPVLRKIQVPAGAPNVVTPRNYAWRSIQRITMDPGLRKIQVPAGAPNVVTSEFTPGKKGYQKKQKVPFGTPDVLTLQFIAGD